MARILYLLEKEHAAWNSIYVLAFNRNVPREISERIQQRITLRSNPKKYSRLDVAQTFHKLSFEWSDHKGKVLAEDKKRFIKLIIEHLKETNSDFAARVYEFFRKESLQVEKKHFKDPQDYYLYTRNTQYRTLKGDTVKSQGEKWIADFLYEHGIDYRYEYSFYPSYISINDINESDDYKQRCLAFLQQGTGETKPDFYLTEQNIVWEHWGIDENETNETHKIEFAKKFGRFWDEYKKKMVWKRGFWKSWRSTLQSGHWAIKAIHDVNKLIETSVCDLNCSREIFEQKLTVLLRSQKITVSKRNEDELIQEVWERSIDRFVIIIESFINRYQQGYFDSHQIFAKRMENYHGNPRVYEFLKLGLEILELYEKELVKSQKIKKLIGYQQYNIDFNQLLLQAIKRIESGDLDEEIQKIKYILIDEYQDFSELFFRLISAVRNRNALISFFCVGDDWQAINRFAGSDTKYFNDFMEYFRNSKIMEISNNYRSNKTIIKKSNYFMRTNRFEGSPAKANQIGNASDIKIVHIEQRFEKNVNEDQIYIDQFISSDGIRENDCLTKAKYLKKCFEIIQANPGKEILILHRNNNFRYATSLEVFFKKLSNVLVQTKEFKSKDECKKRIRIKTMHAAKGLEADVVILLEINQGLIPMFHPDNELFEIFGEDIQVNMDDQKRLFYVAMTRAKERLYILCENDKKSDFLNYL